MVPFFKSGSRYDDGNYRGISLTSVCCKTMERVLKPQIVAYLEENGLLSDFQFGFRRGRSTEDQLLVFYHRVSGWVDTGHTVDVAYLDFSKAFDVVSHTVLLAKLDCLGFDPLVQGWIRAFLEGRTMAVSVAGTRSSARDVTSGVPQGSVLGPVLFLIYVNIVTTGIDCDCMAFAVDFKLCICYPKGSSEASAVGRFALQEAIDRVADVSLSWSLSLNARKCVVVRFGECRAAEREREPYTLNGTALEYVCSYRDLGVIVDD